MSWCRFSSDDFTSDVYAYEDAGGFTAVHVAGSRYPLTDEQLADLPGLPDDTSDPGWGAASVARRNALHTLLQDAEVVPIHHELAGTTHDFATPAEAADFLDLLQAEGFHVPSGVADDMRAQGDTDDE